MSTFTSLYEQPASDRGNPTADIRETATLWTKKKIADLLGRAANRNNADLITRIEGDPNRADPARRDAGGPGSGSVSERGAPNDVPNDPMAAVEAQGLQTLFGAQALPPMLGRYVVLGTLGQGGMGTVLEAFDRTLQRKVAVKVLHEHLDDQYTARLLREARAMAKLSHPNVVPVFEVDTTGDQTFVVMELVQGRTLRDWIRQHPLPDWRQCVEVFIQVGQGLAAAHAAGLVHRDFKPSNAVIDDEGRARVLDFGLACRADLGTTDEVGLGHTQGKTHDDRSPDLPVHERAHRRASGAGDDDPLALDLLSVQALTETGMVMGTPAYMPPEQFKGREADARSDQFSFCVSLYEAVYGERPFAGDTQTRLMTSMTRGGVRPVPKGSPVPARLRTVLLRGLAADPAQRWPSMEALLTELHRLVAPRSARWMAVGMMAGLAALGGGLAFGHYVEVKERCTGAQAQMDGIWDDGRRQQVQDAILGTERPFAPETWQRIEPRLDAYAQAWTATHTEICEATSVRGEQSDQALDLRMRCLDQRRTALRATVDVLADTNAELVHNTMKLVVELPTLTRCDDLPWLEQHDARVPPPDDPDVAAAVEIQRAHLADIAVMHKAGRYAKALDAVEPVLEQAETLGYTPLRAEALYWRGSLRHGNGQYTEAETDLRQAHALAVEHHHDPIALDTAQALTSVVGVALARHAEGRQWGEMVALPLAQRSGEPLDVAHSLNHLGLVLRSQGEYEAAQHHHQRALAIKQKALGPDHPSVAATLQNLGNVSFFSQGDYENAKTYYHKALTIYEKALGLDHPSVAVTLSNLGNVFFSQGDYENARLHYRRALVLEQKALGPDHPDVAKKWGHLGHVFLRQGNLEEAGLHYQRSLAIHEKALGPDHPDVAMSLSNLSAVFLGQRDYDKARDHYQRAIAIKQEALGPDHPSLVSTLSNLGLVFEMQGELDKARAHHQQALEIQHKVDLDHPLVATLRVGLAKVALKAGDPASARAHAERALSIREAATVEPMLLSEARFILADALWSMHSEQARARAMAEQAKQDLVAVGAKGQAKRLLDEIDAWLTEHGAP
ncbi:MAG: tetratricopeptide repeat protein [Myxococcota bacterium]